MIVELGIIALVCLVGWSALTVAGLRGWGIVPLSPIVGTSITVLCGLALLVTGLPTRPAFVLVLTGSLGGVALIVALTRRRQPSLVHLSWLLLGIVAVVSFARSVPLVKYHIDSFRYLSAARLLATDQHEYFGFTQSLSRSLAAPVMHSLASANGEWYLASIAPIVSVAVAGVLAWAVVSSGRAWLSLVPVGGFALLAALLFVTNNRMVWNAFYVNQHLLFGAGFLLVCTATWLLTQASRDQGAALALVGALGGALVVLARPEGFIAATLAVLPGLVSPQLSRAVRRGLLVGIAGVIVVWFGHLALWARSSGRSTPDEILFPLAVGVLGLCFVPLVGSRWLDRHAGRLLGVTEGGLWLTLAAVTLINPSILVRSLAVTYRNVVLDAGSWGMSLVILIGVGIAAMLASRHRSLVTLRFPLTAMAPTFLLLAYLRGSAYRVGNGDSLNRMLTQIVPTLILFVVVAAMMASRPADVDSVESEGGEA